MRPVRSLIKALLHIDDTPRRTALAYSVGVFLGFSPFLGLHTLGGIALAFLFKLNRVAVLLGVWSNTPWWIIPYYTLATWVGVIVMGSRIDRARLVELFHEGVKEGFIRSAFWRELSSQWELLLAFGVGSLLLATLLSFAAYPLSLRLIAFYRSRKAPRGKEFPT